MYKVFDFHAEQSAAGNVYLQHNINDKNTEFNLYTPSYLQSFITCIRDSSKSSFKAKASLVKMSGYCVDLKTFSSSSTCHESKFVLLLLRLGSKGISIILTKSKRNNNTISKGDNPE